MSLFLLIEAIVQIQMQKWVAKKMQNEVKKNGKLNDHVILFWHKYYMN